MAFYYNIDLDQQLIYTTWDGMFLLDDINTNLDKLYRDKLYNPQFRGLCDAREADFQLSAEDIAKNQQFVANHPHKPLGPWAVLCAEPLQTAYAYMYGHFENPPHETQVFSTEAAAMAWLDKFK